LKHAAVVPNCSVFSNGTNMVLQTQVFEQPCLSFGDNYSEKKDDLNRLNYIQRRQEDKGRKGKKEV
jgi:hypothetical protein